MDIDDIMEELYRKYALNIQRVCYLYLGNVTGAEDAMQETFLKAYEKYNLFRGKSDIKTWLTRIAINTCKDMLRKEKVKNNYIEKEIRRNNSDVASVSQGLDDRIEKMVLFHAIHGLSEELREIVILFYYQELSTKSISGILDIPRTTVEFRLKKARRELEKVMKEEMFYE